MFHIMVPNMIKNAFLLYKNCLILPSAIKRFRDRESIKTKRLSTFFQQGWLNWEGELPPPPPNAWKKDVSWSKDNNQLVKMWL